MRVRHRTPALALPVALILGLGGCSSDDEPESGASVTTSAAPTTSEPTPTEPSETREPEPTETGPTPPPRPAAMDDTGKKGARAAAEYFIALTEYAMTTGDTRALTEMAYESTCTTCESLIADAKDWAERDLVVDMAGTELSDFEVNDRDSLTGGYAVTMAFVQPAGSLTDVDGKVQDQWGEDTGWMQFDAMHDGERWRALQLTTDQS
ncbi:hypothetical protein SAMN04489860_2578 [Paraoerskovia marina]|uniref:DUF6318 domain-containing protein n=1 Tax=Paraoerskovia marina TaxID=545619 RepID=A0A1H1VQK0_9CELL|nr:DUF6318 family protein [Paraoerskovia marina]SDS86955.1 hypothetical protein SAMN04489860_2578 [Paraoerskovia marina]